VKSVQAVLVATDVITARTAPIARILVIAAIVLAALTALSESNPGLAIRPLSLAQVHELYQLLRLEEQA
jgi:hypothetical protein